MSRELFTVYLHVARFRGHGFVFRTVDGHVVRLALPRGLR